METKQQLQEKIDGLLSKPHLNATERKQVDGWLSKLADLRADEGRAAQAKAVLAEMGVSTPINENEEFRAAKHMAAFRNYISTGRDEEIRTYTPMTTGGIPLPQPFYAAYQEQLKSFSGIREAGARVITTTTGDPLKNPFSSDTTVGELLAENATASLANPTFSDTVFTSWTYSSKGVQYSANLQKDAGIDVETFLSGIFASRIGRKFNADATNGVGSGMTGIIPSISIVGAGSSATLVAYGDLVDLQNIDAGYLPGSVYMANPKTIRTLRKAVDSSGRRLYPELSQGMLLGYPVVLNVSMDDIGASAKPVAFGNFKLGVTIREVVPTLLVSTERYAEMRVLYSVLLHRQDCQLTDANAVAVLQNAAS